MKHLSNLVFALAVASSLLLYGCSSQKADSSSDALAHAQTLESPEAQLAYLETQAKAFLKSEEYKDALTVATHIQKNLDTGSSAAENVRAEAQEKLSSGLKDAAKKFGK